jgi:hypothetical protein
MTSTAGTVAISARRAARRRPGALAAAAILACLSLGWLTPVSAPVLASQVPRAVTSRCITTPSSCGYPDSTNSGVPPGTKLETVPSEVSSGPGWTFHPGGWITVNGNGATLTHLYCRCNLDVLASDVTIDEVKIMTDGGHFGISLRNTANVTIEHSTVIGQNPTTGRVDSAIKDVHGGSTGTVIKDNDIFNYRTAIVLSAGLIESNYIHNAGYLPGDHTNGVYNDGGDTALTVEHNTIFVNRNQTDAITLDAAAPGEHIANKTITDNLLAGGSYVIYGGASLGNTTSDIVVRDNIFGQQFYAHSGNYGPVAYFDPTGAGNTWTGNAFADGRIIPAP